MNIQPQNRRKTVYGIVIVLIVILILAGVVSLFKNGGGLSGLIKPKGPVATYIPPERVLRNDTYGFEITTPWGVDAEAPFKKFNVLSDSWRVNAPAEGPGSVGTALVAIPVVRIDNNDVVATSSDTGATSTEPKKIYPLFFDVEVRIGVSSSTADCLKADAGYEKQATKKVTIGGTPFTRFSFSDAAMMKYVKGESYRAVHNGLCYVIEQIRTGSTYKEPNMDIALTEKDMDAYYASADSIIKTFLFTK